MWHTGLVAPQHVGSSWTRARTRVPRIGRQILNHCTTREARPLCLKKRYPPCRKCLIVTSGKKGTRCLFPSSSPKGKSPKSMKDVKIKNKWLGFGKQCGWRQAASWPHRREFWSQIPGLRPWAPPLASCATSHE